MIINIDCVNRNERKITIIVENGVVIISCIAPVIIVENEIRLLGKSMIIRYVIMYLNTK